MKCERCGRDNPKPGKFCEFCGSRMPEMHLGSCPKCGTVNDPADMFCQNCGTRLHTADESVFADAPLTDQAANVMPPLRQEAYPSDHGYRQPSPAVNQPTGIQAGTQSYGSQWNQPETPVQQKRTKIFAIAAGAVLVLGAVGVGGWFLLNNNNGSPSGTRIEENRDYLVLNASSIVKDVSSGASAGNLDPGKTIFLVSSVAGNDGIEWGETQEGTWVKMSDKNYTYMVPEDTVSYSAVPENKPYEVGQKSDVFTIPDNVSEPLSNLSTGTEVYVYETVMDAADKWGRIGEDQWVRLNDANNTYLSAKETKTTADAKLQADKENGEDKEDKKEDKAESKEEPTKVIVQTVPVPVETPAPAPETQDSMGGYTKDWYQCNYGMKVRSAPDYSAAEIKSKKKNDTVYISGFRAGSNASTWGEIDHRGSGQWICMTDYDYNYLTPYEPAAPSKPAVSSDAGTYKLNTNMKVRSSGSYSGTHLDTIDAGKTIYAARTSYNNDKHSTWAELDYEGSGKWMCIKDDDGVYLVRQ